MAKELLRPGWWIGAGSSLDWSRLQSPPPLLLAKRITRHLLSCKHPTAGNIKKFGQKSKFSFLGWTNVESQDFYIFFWYFVGLIRTVAKQVACSVTWNQSVDSALQWQPAQHCRWLLNIVVQSNHCWNAGCLLEMRTLLELYKGTKTSPVIKGWVVTLTYG